MCENEVYFDELWVAEGITSYYDELALVRARINSPKDYLAGLSKQIETLQTGPGRLRQSLVESSRDAWIKFYRPDENSANTSINYYIKGAVVGFLLDASIRKRTNNQKTLDDVMRILYERHANKDGYTNSEVIRVASEITGSDMQGWLERAISSTSELDYSEALDWLGLAFQASKADEKPDDAKESDKTKAAAGKSANEKTPEIWTGVTLDAKMLATRIVEGSPAFAAGVNVGDEIIGIDGFRLSEPLEERLKQYKVGEVVNVLVSRRGKLIEIALTLPAKPTAAWKLEQAKEPTPQQRENFASWLGL